MPAHRIAAATLAACFTTGCASLAPYPTRYQAGDVDAPRPGANCTDHANRDAVIACLQRRAQGWEKTGAAIRGQGFLTGSFAIPAAATAIGLAAEGDPNHAVGILGLVTASAVTHTSAYARGEQAKVAEAAVVAYGCLIKEAGDWNGELFGVLETRYGALAKQRDTLQANLAQLINLRPPPSVPRPAGVTDTAAVTSLITQINAAIAAGDAARGSVRAAAALDATDAVDRAKAVVDEDRKREDAVGSDLIGQAVQLDGLATQAMANLVPDPAAVASSARASIGSAVSQFTPTPVTAPAAPPPPPPPPALHAAGVKLQGDKGKPPTAAEAAEAARIQAQYEADLAAVLKRAQDYRAAAEGLKPTVEAEIREFDAAQGRFQLAAAAYRPASASTACTATFGGAAAFTVEPGSPITMTSAKASFELVGGLPPHRFVRAPDDVSVNMVVISSTVSHVEVTVNDFGTASVAGPWDLVFYDGSSGARPMTVRLQRAPH